LSSIRIIDTSVLCNLLQVPRRRQHAPRALAEFRAAIAAQDLLLLPTAVIYETGNHIAQNGDGRERRAVARAFVEMVEGALAGKLPFTPTPLPTADEMLEWVGSFPDHAAREIGLGDLSIIQLWEEQCRLHAARRVAIWSYDEHLRAYDRGPLI
jgi:predicted nucleic acid-binding protein